MKLANYSSTVAGVETVHIFCGNCQRSQSYKGLAILFFWIRSGKSSLKMDSVISQYMQYTYSKQITAQEVTHRPLGKCAGKSTQKLGKWKIAFKNAQGKIALRKQGRERIKAVLGLTCLAEIWRASFVRKSLFNSTVYAFVDGAQRWYLWSSAIHVEKHLT